MTVENFVTFRVTQQGADGEEEEVYRYTIRDDDFNPHEFQLPGDTSMALRFELRDSSELAKALATASVIMPWVVIIPTGEEIQLSRTRKQIVNEYYSNVTIEHAPLEKEDSGGHVCGECIYFSRQKGKELLTQVTHTFVDNEKGRMVEAIVDVMAEQNKSPTLTIENVGYCPQKAMLCATDSPACKLYPEIEAVDKE